VTLHPASSTHKFLREKGGKLLIRVERCGRIPKAGISETEKEGGICLYGKE
jgi:hypothetical protein